MLFHTLPYYNSLRSNATLIDRLEGSNLDVVHLDDSDDGFALCHLIHLQEDEGISPTQQFFIPLATALAVEHLNTADSSFVEDVNIMDKKCPNLKFTYEPATIEATAESALSSAVQLTDRQRKQREFVIINDERRPPSPCAFVGTGRSTPAISSSIITGLRGYPQISGSATSKELDNRATSPLFARTIGSDNLNAFPILKFLREDLNVKNLAVLHANEPYGNAYAAALREASKEQYTDFNLVTVSMPYDINKIDNSTITEVVRSLKNTRFRYFFCTVFDLTDMILTEAYHQGIAGNKNHSWFFSDSLLPSTVLDRTFERGSVLHQAYQGIGIAAFSSGDGGTEFVSRAAAMLSRADQEFILNQFPDNVNFDNFDITTEEARLSIQQAWNFYGPFFYDATIALGLSACNAVNSMDNGALSLNGKHHYETLLQLEFEGVTGHIQFGKETGTRRKTVTGLVNYFEDRAASTESRVQFTQVPTHRYQNMTWHKLNDFVFQSGSTKAPPDLPPVDVERNHLTPATKIIAVTMSTIAMALAIGFACWTRWNQNIRVVKASQPFFLYAICIGAFIMASSILPIVIDPSSASLSGCALACNVAPWLICIGFSLVFSALFTKTFRANKILNNPTPFKRITVTVSDVLIPMVVLLSANLFMLSLMTALEPAEWEINVKSKDSLRGVAIETYGECGRSDQTPYIAVLAVINFCTFCIAIYQAYRARHLATEFAESKHIFKSLVTSLAVLFACGPVVILANDNPITTIFVTSAIVFVISANTLLWIFIPKVLFAQKRKSNIKVTGLSPSRPSTSGDDLTDNNGENEGERIISTLSPRQLLLQNARLRRQNELLSSRLSANEH